MNKTTKCEFCGRIIKDDPVRKVLRGKNHVYCSDFCFRLNFFGAPPISYEELQNMYSYYCVSLPAKDFYKTVNELKVEED
jgi:hypothetical protein